MKKNSIPKKIELCFDIAYLLTALGLALYYLQGDSIYIAWGIICLVLFIGDLAHLVPRILIILTDNEEKFAKSASIGKLITSMQKI